VEAGAVEGRREREMGKWPVWKVLLWRRRWPDMDFGSGVVRTVSWVGRETVVCGLRGGGLAFGVEFEDVDVAVGVGNEDEELLVVGEEVGRHDF